MSYISIPPSSAGSQSYTDNAISNLVSSAPAALDTLNELANALGGDENFATTVANSIAAKAPIASPTFTGGITTPAIISSNIAGELTIAGTTTTGSLRIGGSFTTGAINIGTGTTWAGGAINIGTGAMSSGTKNINIGTGGTAGSGVNINLGTTTATSSVINANATTYLNATTFIKSLENGNGNTGTFNFLPSQTAGTVNFASGTFAGNLNLGAGTITSGTKVIRLGTGGGAGSTTQVHVGSNLGTSTTALYGKVSIADGATNVPASATAAGTAGQIAWDANYIYVCTATNTWVRAALSTW